MTSAMRAPRSDLADCSPKTQLTASDTFDLPQPLGPTIEAMPDPGNCNCCFSQNDLKPKTSIFFSLSKAVPKPYLTCPADTGHSVHTTRVRKESKAIHAQYIVV